MNLHIVFKMCILYHYLYLRKPVSAHRKWQESFLFVTSTTSESRRICMAFFFLAEAECLMFMQYSVRKHFCAFGK
jgi:hypothetical protein